MDLTSVAYSHRLLDGPLSTSVEVPFAYAVAMEQRGPTVCLFGLKPDTPRHPHLVDTLWPIVKDLSYQLFPDVPRDSITWFLGHKWNATEIRFHELQGQLFGVQFSDESALTMSKFQSAESFADLQGQMADKTLADIKELAFEYDEPGAKPTTMAHPGLVWAVETPHATGGIAYLQPKFQGSTVENQFAFILVDTQRLLDKIYAADPEMRQHVKHKFRGESVQAWLAYNNPEQPLKMPSFAMTARNDSGVDLAMETGFASMLEVMRLAEFPFVPIAVKNHSALDDLYDITEARHPGAMAKPPNYGQPQTELLAKLKQEIGAGPSYCMAAPSRELGLPPTPRFEI